MQFRRNANGLLLKEDFRKLLGACKTIGNAIYDVPGQGMTENGNDYLPADLMHKPEEIRNALEIINAYFGYARQVQKVSCISKRFEQIKIGQTYYLDLTSVHGDSDGDWYGDVYSDSKKETYIGHFMLRHFQSVT